MPCLVQRAWLTDNLMANQANWISSLRMLSGGGGGDGGGGVVLFCFFAGARKGKPLFPL